MADALHRLAQCFGQTHATFAIALQQVERHTLRALGTDAGQAAQRVD